VLAFWQKGPIAASVFHQDTRVYTPVKLHLRDGRKSFIRQSALARLQMTASLRSHRVSLAWKESPKVTTGYNPRDDHPGLMKTRFTVVQDGDIDHDFVLGNRACNRLVVLTAAPSRSPGPKKTLRGASPGQQSCNAGDMHLNRRPQLSEQSTTTEPWRDDQSSKSGRCHHGRMTSRHGGWTEAVGKAATVIAFGAVVATVSTVFEVLLGRVRDFASCRW